MLKLKHKLPRVLTALLFFPWTSMSWANAYDAHPKLVVIVVIDQFRGDYLERYRGDFKGRGFRLFLDHGAYFEDCYYNYANTKTAPGHATLGTGAYTDGHGISSNEWWDLSRDKQHRVSSVEDDRYRVVGEIHPLHGGGASPQKLRASTLGDELRLATQGQAKVFGVSLKDRAAILPTGYAANGAYWIDETSGSFITSSYYMEALPDWATAFNSSDRIAQAQQEAGSPTKSFYAGVGPTPAANAYELDFARALINGEQLGNHAVTDLLVVSLSANDLLGHQMGPDSPQERLLVDGLDQQLDGFFSWLDTHIPGGLASTYIALSADHGVAPVPAQAAALGMPAASLDLTRFTATLNEAMNAKFSPGEKVAYLLPDQELPYLALNRPSFEVAGINEQEAEQAVQLAVPAAVAAVSPNPPPAEDEDTAPAAKIAPVPPAPPPPAPETALPAAAPTAAAPNPKQHGRGRSSATAQTAKVVVSPPPPPVLRQPVAPMVVHTYTRQELAGGQLPPSEWGLLLAHSYSPNGGWYVMVIPEAYQMQTLTYGTTHFSPWSYDRHVPLGFFGAPFTPGLYHGRVEPVDLAATLASLLGINQPSASVGTVLTQAIHAVAPLPAPRVVRSGKRRAEDQAAPNP